jgi:Mor family transcriptional regulator
MERNNLIATDYLSGMTLQSVAEKYGITRQRVQQIVAKMGVNRPPILNSTRLRKYDYDEIVSYYREHSPTLTEATKKFNCSTSTIRNALFTAGLSTSKRTKFTTDAVQDVVTRYRAGERLVLIGKSYDVSAQYINTVLRRAGVQPVRRSVK